MFSGGMFSTLLFKHLICTKHKELSYKLHNWFFNRWCWWMKSKRITVTGVNPLGRMLPRLNHWVFCPKSWPQKVVKIQTMFVWTKEKLVISFVLNFSQANRGRRQKKQTFYIVFQWLNTDSLTESFCPLRRLHQEEKKKSDKIKQKTLPTRGVISAMSVFIYFGKVKRDSSRRFRGDL